MGKVLLLISKPWQEFTHLRVNPTVSANASMPAMKTLDRVFQYPNDLVRALFAAGVPDHETYAPFLVSDTGLPTFIPVDSAVARRLGVVA